MKYTDYVNIKQGSASVRRFSNGNTLPLVQRPFGMCSLCLQTSSESSWYYHPQARSFEGIRITHQPSPWIGDYGNVVFMPQNNIPAFSADCRWSGFRPEDNIMTPYYMKVTALRSGCIMESAPSERGCSLRLRYKDNCDNWFSVLPVKGYSEFYYDYEKNQLKGFVTGSEDDKDENFRMYIIAEFLPGQICKDGHICGWDNCECTSDNIKGDMAGIHLKVNGNKVDIRVAISYISYEQAYINMLQDFTDRSFEQIKEEAFTIWEEYLSRVEIDAYSDEQLKTFYSCMYRAFLYPHKCYEINDKGIPVHYSPGTGKIYEGVRYTDNGFWDTYRTCYPFYALTAREEYSEMCRGFVNDYIETGWLPRWTAMTERGCMPSTLIDAVICDAAVKNIIDRKTLRTAFEGMLKHAEQESEKEDFGRNGCEEYCRLGYVPVEAHRESVNLTLDAAYGDWCISVIADILGEKEIAEKYKKRGENYKNLFDPETGFMRAKYRNGKFREHFSPCKWGLDYTEGSAWQNSFAVPHDVEGLAGLYGGKEELIKKLDELFSTPPIYETGGYSGEIHEMTEMAAADFGQCAISNQPSFHLPYLYSELGDVEKTSHLTEKICRELFSYKDDGFPGDEDNGSMALWYVFSTIGIYPLCPGKNEYVRTKKLVKGVKILGREFDADAFEGNRISYDVFGKN